eukprot:Skav224100  [mRNA]  locus=scaffold4565:138849:139821:- [translate_table: standard]
MRSLCVSRQALLQRFGTVAEVRFSSPPNLTSEEREAIPLSEIIKVAKAADSKKPMFLVGHSFGARALVHLLARNDFRRQLPSNVRGIIAQLGTTLRL